MHDTTPDARGRRDLDELARGLRAPRASIAPRWFYDDAGSRLFTAICELPEYYPTRTERGILLRQAETIAAEAGRGGTLIDLGAGDCVKGERLLPHLRARAYLPVDVSIDFVREAASRVADRHPSVTVRPLAADFTHGLALPPELPAPRVFFYPGSSIGNFEPARAVEFLALLRRAGEGAASLVIGVDLVKPVDVLEAAYDDARGLTARFNLNMLLHVNRVLGSDFDTADWRHVAFFDAAASRIEMHLEARRALLVRWPGGERRFAAGERIHTEDSFKYTPDGFDALLREAGWRATGRHCDDRGWFAVFVAH